LAGFWLSQVKLELRVESTLMKQSASDQQRRQLESPRTTLHIVNDVKQGRFFASFAGINIYLLL